MKYLLFLIFSLFVTCSFARITSVNNIPGAISRLYVIQYSEYNGKKHPGPQLNKTMDSTDPLYALTHKYDLYSDYFLFTYGLINAKNLFKNESDSLASLKELDSFLCHNIFFTKCINLLLYSYSKTTSFNYTAYKVPAKKIVSINDLLEIASKFFYADTILEDTDVSWHICVGFNPFNMENMRSHDENSAFIEAFCFSSIMKNTNNDSYTFYDAFEKNANQIEKDMRRHPSPERLKWIRQQMYTKMAQNVSLKKLLLSEYATNKGFLPFEVRHLDCNK